MSNDPKLETALAWLGTRWLLAKPARKLPATAHVRVPVERWQQMSQHIARVLEGAEHV